MEKASGCIGCVLWGSGHGFSRLEGAGTDGLLVIAEALGEHEEDDALPLRPHGAAGRVFGRALRELGIHRSNLGITNMIRCRPPDNELVGAPYERAALDQCRGYLDAAVAKYRPRAILALGNTPLRELTEFSGVLTYRGYILPSAYNIPLIATYHPALLSRGALGTLFGVFKRDIALAHSVAQHGIPAALPTHYELHPSVDRVREFLAYVLAHAAMPLGYDTETAHILHNPDELDPDRLIQIQFSCRPGQAIVLPYTGEYQQLAKAIMSGPNPKWGWNSRGFDDELLRRNGFVINGDRHDLMLAWQHQHPDFASQKDGDESGEGDKGVVARLMNLQAALSFFHPEAGPWKHLSGQLELYGAMDADYTVRCGVGIFAALEKQGLMRGYLQHKFELRRVLDDMGARGLPIDAQKQTEVRDYCTGEIERMSDEIQRLVPLELRALHPGAEGFKTLAPKVKRAVEIFDVNNPPTIEYSNFSGVLEQLPNGKWAVRKLFNVGSSKQLIGYIKHRGYRVPKRIDDPAKDTTGKDELAKLAKETGDPLLLLTDSYRKFTKMASNYVGKVVDGKAVGYWVPGPDGCVHPTFGWGTGSAQLTASRPNAMQFPEHGPLAKKAKAMIVAAPGHTFVKRDMRGFHSRMIGFLAEDEAYYKLADFDVHSFISAHYLRLPEAPGLLDLSDADLRTALEAIKAEHGYTRNYKVKRCVHGRQFNMGVNKLYNMHAPDFDPKPETLIAEVGERTWDAWGRERQIAEISKRGRREAKTLFDLFDALFPRTFVTYPAIIANQIKNVTKCHLLSPFGHIRWFWDYDKEKSTAFLPSNCAHCHIQYGLLTMQADGALDKYNLVNFTHDAVWFHCPDQYVSECISYSARIMERPSDVLFNSWGAFSCNSDAEVGKNMVEMRAV